MANTAVKISASPNHLSYLLTGDGTVVGPTIANATLLADMVRGPLEDAYNQEYTTDGTSVQSAMRKALLGGLVSSNGLASGVGQGFAGGCVMWLQAITTVADTTAQINQPSVDVDTDAVTAVKPEVNITMSDTTGTLYMLHIFHLHSIIQ